MKTLFDDISYRSSKIVTEKYSTSFSLGIRCFKKPIRKPKYAIYGFVRLADEIVDSFHEYEKDKLFYEFKKEVYRSIERKISLNPILNSFQDVVNNYNIEQQWIDLFLASMEMDLFENRHTERSYNKYILGSAEVVGLMCLHVFCNGDKQLFESLKEPAMQLGSAYQKVNFLRDLSADLNDLGRIYFPGIQLQSLNEKVKIRLISEIESEFKIAYNGILELPKVARFGVFLSYVYYYSLLQKIKRTPVKLLLHNRIRISNFRKYILFFYHSLRYKLTIS